MALPLTIKHFCFALALLIIASSCSKAQATQPQDSVQIVAKAALCFDNKTVIMNCLSSAGQLANGSTAANSTFCHGPCFGHAMMMVNCLDGIFSNFQFYSSNMMLGVKSVFQVACGKNVTGNSSDNLVAINRGTELAVLKELTAYISMLLASFFLL